MNCPAGKTPAVVFPDSLQEIKNLIKLSEEDIIPRGNGSSFTGGVLPDNSIILDLSKMNNIIEINPERKTAKVEPGVLLSDFNEELEQYGLEFPIQPIFAGIETIGGMLAKNSSGNREIKYSRMMNWVDSIEIINGKGEQIKVSKSDLSDFIGMEGTTGVIISANLKLTPKKDKSFMILKADNLTDVFAANKRIRMNMDVSSVDLLNKEISAASGLENKYHIFIELESLKGSIRGAEYEKFSKIKNQAYKKASLLGFWRMENAKFLVDSLPDFLLYAEEKNIPYFAHLASGSVYFMFKPEESKKREETLKLAKKLKGKIGYNLGIGMACKDFLEPGEKDIIKRVKTRHDPKHKLNTEKIVNSTFEGRKKDIPIINELPEPQKMGGLINFENEKTEEDNLNIKSENQEPKKIEDSENLAESETKTFKRNEPELSPEEKEKIKKIAAGFFAGGRASSSENK